MFHLRLRTGTAIGILGCGLALSLGMSSLVLVDFATALAIGALGAVLLTPLMFVLLFGLRGSVDEQSALSRALLVSERYRQFGGGIMIGYIVAWTIAVLLPAAFANQAPVFSAASILLLIVFLYIGFWFAVARIYLERDRTFYTRDHSGNNVT